MSALIGAAAGVGAAGAAGAEAAFVAATTGVLAAAVAAQQPESPGALAESLIKLRAEVEQLNNDVELTRQEARTQAAALAALRAELQATVGRSELNVRKLREDLAKRQAEGRVSVLLVSLCSGLFSLPFLPLVGWPATGPRSPTMAPCCCWGAARCASTAAARRCFPRKWKKR